MNKSTTKLLLCGMVIMLKLSNALLAQQAPGYEFSTKITKYGEDDSTLRANPSWKHAFRADAYSFIGAYAQALAASDSGATRSGAILTKTDRTYFQGFRPQPAVEYITERVKRERLVIINENHRQPLHRVFTASLLTGLYQAGFRCIGFEALVDEDSLLNQRKYPVLSSGYYTEEPQFGNLIREALRLGFTVFAYEASSGKSGAEREAEQAATIRNFMDQHPQAKLLIHCGYDHVVERDLSDTDWGKAMAGRLKDLTGIDPFTINQVELTERSSPDYEAPFYQLTQVDYPAVFTDSLQRPFTVTESTVDVDIKVAHPRTKFINGRPNWLFRDGKWKPYPLKKQVFTVEPPCLVAAFPVGEDIDQSIPVDQIEILSYQADNTLVLPAGTFVIQVKNQKEQRQRFTIIVPEQK